jgi:hypothetical protein
MRMSQVVIAAAIVALLSAACSSSGSESSDTSTTGPSSLSGKDLVRRVSVHQADVKSGDTVTLIPEGDRVAGQVTLDLCSATFASEQQRQVRYQVQTATSNGSSAGIGSEAVLYASPEAAQQALEEVRAAQANCPTGFVDSTVPGVPPVKTTFGPVPDARWRKQAGIDRLAQNVTISTEDGRSIHKLLVFQVRGAMLVGLYVTPETAPKQLDKSIGSVEGLVDTVAKRLAALPAGALANAPAV